MEVSAVISVRRHCVQNRCIYNGVHSCHIK